MSKGKKILVVDDDAPTRKLISLTLAAMSTNDDIFEASSAAEALRILDQHCVDGILTDYSMPVMNGVELVRLLRKDQRWMQVPVALVSCCFTAENLVEAKSLGITCCLAKLFRRQQLQNVVRGMIPKTDRKRR
ncbi:MAG: response regulator [Desulfuromonadaceae bacterium]|nr:response regulator [Desulfuromonadaceae bacterium]